MSDAFRTLNMFAERLDAARIHYRLEIARPGWVMFCISVPEEYWEVEFNGEGETEVEVFCSRTGVREDAGLEELF